MPQTQQGADRLAKSCNALVVMPDLFKGEPLTEAYIRMPDGEEKKRIQKTFMEGNANLETNLKNVERVLSAVAARYTSVQAWGAYGLCWGGKIVALASGKDSAFKASGQAHPGRLAKEDAEALTIPHICLFSKEDGTPDLVKEYDAALSTKKTNEVEHYSTMHHGWMGGRANFDSEENVQNFEKGLVEAFLMTCFSSILVS